MSADYVYVASSWRNPMHPAVIHVLRAAGLPHYDFRNPAEGDTGFAWADVGLTDPCTAAAYLAGIEHPRAVDGFAKDMAAMKRADTFVLVLPCGRSAHLELGWAVGAGKRTAVLLDGEDSVTPELMYRMCDYVAPNVFSLLGWLGVEDVR